MADDEIDDTGPLKPHELKRLRRMLQDDFYARRFKTTLKIWTITFGTVATLVVAGFNIWREVVSRLWR